MSEALTEAAPAKINLYLHVVGRREDGYHLLDSLVVFAGVADQLTASPSTGLTLSLTGPFAAGLRTEADNLVLRAAHVLAAEMGVIPSGRINLEKNLPVASGIGGGSADAAAALRLLSRLWRVSPAQDRLHRLAQDLGADVPVCLVGRAARMAGIGEQLGPAPLLPDAGIILVNPGIGISTPAVFGARSGGFSTPASLPRQLPDAVSLAAALRATRNDLEPAARLLAPVIGEVLEALAANPTCLMARMSGSGATCFGLYRSPSEAKAAARNLVHPGWWVWGGAVNREQP